MVKSDHIIKSEMTIEQLRQILDWKMCSDPWPGGDIDVVDDWLDGVCREFGYKNWVEAYHFVTDARELFPGTIESLNKIGGRDED